MKKVNFKTAAGSQYLIGDNQISFRLKRYSDGAIKPQPLSKVTVFIAPMSNLDMGYDKALGNNETSIKIESLIPLGGLVPFEMMSSRIDYDIDLKEGVLRIHNLQDVHNGPDYHFGHKILADSIRWCDDSGEYADSNMCVSEDAVWSHQYRHSDMTWRPQD